MVTRIPVERRRKIADRPQPAAVRIDGDVVHRVEKIGPTHARDLHHMAGISLSIRQGEPCSSMRVDFELSCGIARLSVGDHTLELSMRLCHVTLQRQNADLVPHSSYQHQLIDGMFEAAEVETSSSEARGGTSLSIDMGAKANTGGATIFGRIGAGLNRVRAKAREKKETVRRQARIDIVVTSGQDRWQVGDTRLGDARRAEGQLLGSYFGERRDEDGDPIHLCILSRTRSAEPVEITVLATVPVTHLTIAKLEGSVREDAISSIRPALRRQSSRAIKDHIARRDELLTRIAGLTAATALSEAQKNAGIGNQDGEILIALQTLIIPQGNSIESETPCGP